MRLRILAGIAVAAALPGVAEAQFSLYLPNGAATTEGGSQITFPFGRNAGALRQQHIYDSSNFSAQGVNVPILVLGARWRANATTTTTSWTGTTYSNVELNVATAAVDHALASATFATNRGVDYTAVYNGAVSFAAGAGNGNGVPGPNVVDVTFATPFLYDPSTGNDFLCEVAFAANSWSGGSTTSHDVITTGSLSSRVFNSSDPALPSGTVTPNSGIVIELRYVPATGLHANFEAALTAGATPLTVSFADRSYSSAAGGVQTWAWDMNGDSIVDTNAQNPSFTYTTCGSYDVRLTVTDAVHPTASILKPAFVNADPQFIVDANFTGSPRAGVVPFTTTFTDLSTGTPTMWAWDLDGDAFPDSTAQHPSFTYRTPGIYAVTLTARNACYGSSETKTAFIYAVGTGTNLPADLLCYQMNEVRGNQVTNVATSGAFPSRGTLPHATWQRGPGAGRARYDANEAGFGCLSYSPPATPSNWINTGNSIAAAGSLTVTWWARRDPASTVASPFGYFFGDGSFRCFMGSGGILFSGGSVLTTSYGANFQGHLVSGIWNHYAIVIDNANGVNVTYENGVPHSSPRLFTPNTYSYSGTANLLIGAATLTGGSPASAHYDMDDFRIYGSALSQADIIATMENEYASNSSFDTGCAGFGGTPVLGAAQRPTIPNPTYSLDATNLEPGRPATIVLGTVAQLGGLLPIDLSGLLGAGCALGVLPEISVPVFTGGGSVSVPIPLPIDPLLNGYHGYAQAIVLGTSGAVSNALDVNMQIN